LEGRRNYPDWFAGDNGGGLNGSVTLTPGATVFDNGGSSVLEGGSGRDLFFASAADTIIGRRKDESVFAMQCRRRCPAGAIGRRGPARSLRPIARGAAPGKRASCTVAAGVDRWYSRTS
jgi:hypothetical protein